MKINQLLSKIGVFALGLFIMAFGVALSVKANLGVSPISCIPYVCSFKVPLTLGTLTIIFNLGLILLQVAVLRRNYSLLQLMQLPVVFTFGIFIDFAMRVLSNLDISNYYLQVFWCLTSCVVIGLGVFLEVKAKFTYLPGEGLAMAIADTFNKEFGKVKIGVDSSMVILGVFSSYVFLHQLQGIREGTVVAALFVGFIARFFGQHIHIFDFLLARTSSSTIAPDDQSSVDGGQLVVTISREYGSGGHEIGQLLAQRLRIAFYDKELIELTTQNSGFTSGYIAQNEQRLSHSLLAELSDQNYAYVFGRQVPHDVLFLVQSKIIREICAREACVVVGRCANFILHDHPNCFNVFIHANDTFRLHKATQEYGIEDHVSGYELKRIDKERANYCKHYTGVEWNNADNYDLCVDRSAYDAEQMVDLIIRMVKQRKG